MNPHLIYCAYCIVRQIIKHDGKKTFNEIGAYNFGRVMIAIICFCCFVLKIISIHCTLGKLLGALMVCAYIDLVLVVWFYYWGKIYGIKHNSYDTLRYIQSNYYAHILIRDYLNLIVYYIQSNHYTHILLHDYTSLIIYYIKNNFYLDVFLYNYISSVTRYIFSIKNLTTRYIFSIKIFLWEKTLG